MDRDRRRRILVNGSEVQTDAALREAVAAAGFRLDAKVRVADALDIDRSGLSDAAYSYALRSHFDWLVSDLETTKVEFAIEFDGPSHTTEPVQARDRLKDEICRRLDLPLLRIDAAVLRPHRQRTVLAVLIDAWSLYRGFLDAQEAGTIPWDEPFDPHFALDAHEEDGRLVVEQPYHLGLQGLAHVRRLLGKGAIRGWRHAMRYGLADGGGWDVAFAWAYLADLRVIFGRARSRVSTYPAFASIDLADDLSWLDLSDRLHRWEEGDPTIATTVDALVAAGVPRVYAEWNTRITPETSPDLWGFGSSS